MDDQSQNSGSTIDQLSKRISDLELRLERLERGRISPGISPLSSYSRDAESPVPEGEQWANNQNESIESKVGEYGMAWLGNIVLLFGILFLSQLLQKNNQVIFSLVFSFGAVAGIYLLGYYTKASFPYMSQLFRFNGHILLYIASMRVFVFSGSKLIENTFLAYGIVLVVIMALMYFAYRNRSQILAVLVWIMALITALYSNSTHLMLALLVGITWTSLFFVSRNGWWTGLIISIGLVYITFLLWIMSNPIISGSFQVIPNHQYGFIYLFTCALSYSFLALIPFSAKIKDRILKAGIIFNGLGFSFILALTVLAFLTDSYSIYFGLIAAFSMSYSIWLQACSQWKSIAAMYAIYGFVSLSICIAGIYHFPLAFFLLAIQSLLVLSMALWFKSRFIVIMNTFLFLGLLITYLAIGDSLDSTNFSFALVALITARVMNWKKKRLEIRTELIRNIYLFTGFVMILYSLHHALPPQFVTMSWTIAALLFFLLSVLMKNMKYRWLAILTMIIAVFYLFLVDLQNISLGYRIVALLFISIISLGISVFYTRRLKNKEKQEG